MHLAILTRTTLKHRGISLDSTCPINENEPETLIHCLFNCNWANAIWNSTMGPSYNLLNKDSLIFTWSQDNIEKLDIVIPITMWLIWCARNTF